MNIENGKKKKKHKVKPNRPSTFVEIFKQIFVQKIQKMILMAHKKYNAYKGFASNLALFCAFLP